MSLKESTLVIGCKKWREVDCKIVTTLGRIKARTEHFLNHFNKIKDVHKVKSANVFVLFHSRLSLAFLTNSDQKTVREHTDGLLVGTRLEKAFFNAINQGKYSLEAKYNSNYFGTYLALMA
ncbi:hypothetical protein RO3G_11892 [Rhizopus delemar RA 99-880]|uniref:Uncharacterized protein n=1 Tax=Rhizopus delemar (strain RA 99-880 / ATCC MYA-4621 / FGSC 9543 / NRRL 43880) TaxID=246409 RepID=I1CFF1_RHIO9|nr:hypothetical protein RO3G_11892 [Rhizopus delemar RA 99-880]|eukprot:EIE87181.1 hypothetical protein RO3G_11892 [Rhizopus delemar RA 99-880]